MRVFNLIKEDFIRYGGGIGALTNPTLILVIVYRLCSEIQAIRIAPIRWFLGIFFLPCYKILSIILGIELPRRARIGGGLVIHHFGCIVVHCDTVMGANCSLRHGVTLGKKNKGGKVPVCGNNVDFGAGCKVLGNISIGNNVTIGANAVVLCDVPDDSIAVGIPAKVLPKNRD